MFGSINITHAGVFAVFLLDGLVLAALITVKENVAKPTVKVEPNAIDDLIKDFGLRPCKHRYRLVFTGTAAVVVVGIACAMGVATT